MEKTRKLTTIVLWALMVISVVVFVLMVTGIDSENDPGVRAQQLITLNINWAYVLFGMAALTVLGFSVAQIFGDKKKAIGALISVAILGVVLAISYSVASDVIPQLNNVDELIADGIISNSISKWVGTGLYATYILFAGALGSIVVFSVARMFKR